MQTEKYANYRCAPIENSCFYHAHTDASNAHRRICQDRSNFACLIFWGSMFVCFLRFLGFLSVLRLKQFVVTNTASLFTAFCLPFLCTCGLGSKTCRVLFNSSTSTDGELSRDAHVAGPPDTDTSVEPPDPVEPPGLVSPVELPRRVRSSRPVRSARSPESSTPY